MAKNSPYQHYNNQIGVRISYILTDDDRNVAESVGLMGWWAYKKRCARKKDFRLKEGKGKGNEALVRWEAFDFEEQHVLIEAFGDPKVVAHPMEEYFNPDADALRFYTDFRFDDGTHLKPEQIEIYTINASVLNAVVLLKNNRIAQRKMRGGKIKGIWESIISDVALFNNILKSKYNGKRHTLPNSTKLKQKLNEYKKTGYASLVDGRNKNSNRQVVTAEMLQLWANIYAGQLPYKPNHKEVHAAYCQFLEGKVEIANTNTLKRYKPDPEVYNKVSVKTVFNHQNLWENKIGTHSKRSGDRQVYTGLYIPHHNLDLPECAGSILSIDDRQPKFKAKETGKRIWFYNAIDIASGAFTCCVYGLEKKDIILKFYKQLVSNYATYQKKYGINMPYELECESSLNSSFTDTFLQNGAMFQNVRIEANNARGKIIENRYRALSYEWEKKRFGYLSRPFAKDEANQASSEDTPLLPMNEIIDGCLRDIWAWNNSPHPNQELYPKKTRWQVFLHNQHKAIPPTNWAGILPHIGECRESSMSAGIIRFKGVKRDTHMVGINGELALGDDLIKIMRQIEGCKVNVYFLEGDKGEVLKALVYDMEGRMVCELMVDYTYNRATLERTPEGELIRAKQSAYAATVQKFRKEVVSGIDKISIYDNTNFLEQIENTNGEIFEMPGISHYKPSEGMADVLPDIDDDEYMVAVPTPTKRSLKDRY
jgi:hypothetical protein